MGNPQGRRRDDKNLLLAGFQVRSLVMLTVITGPSMDKNGRDITTFSWLSIHSDLGSDSRSRLGLDSCEDTVPSRAFPEFNLQR